MDTTHVVTQKSETEKLNNLSTKTARTLFSLSSVWPFSFFPNRIRIDENKVDVIYHTFFSNYFVFSVLIKNITGVTVTTGLFFASLSIEITGFEKNPDDVFYLKKSEAEKAKRIILGLVTASREGIDISKIPSAVLIKKIEEVGAAKKD